jgi:transcriptional regulator with XRE-family HTH domain
MIHENLKRIRVHFGATQQQLADYLNVSPQSISKWEKGEAYPSIEYLPKMAEFFHCGINTFFSEYELQIYEQFAMIDEKDLTGLFESMLKQAGLLKDDRQVSVDELEWEETVPVESMFLPALYEYLKENDRVSMAGLQKFLKIGYALAGRISDALVRMGIIDESNLKHGRIIVKEKIDLLLPYMKMKA